MPVITQDCITQLCCIGMDLSEEESAASHELLHCHMTVLVSWNRVLQLDVERMDQSWCVLPNHPLLLVRAMGDWRMVGLDDLMGLFQSWWFCDSKLFFFLQVRSVICIGTCKAIWHFVFISQGFLKIPIWWLKSSSQMKHEEKAQDQVNGLTCKMDALQVSPAGGKPD